jgi:membrane protease YdiL (CAAX protease family)
MDGSYVPQRALGTRDRLVLVLRQHQLLSFFAIAYAFTWFEQFVLLYLLGLPTDIGAWLGPVAGPTGAAIIMTLAVDGRTGLARLARRIGLWRVGLHWYLFALLGIPVAYLLGTIVLPGALASFDSMSPFLFVGEYLLLLTAGGIIGGPFFEEPGWRGFALPRLQAQLGPTTGSVVLGALWGLWHLPQYFAPDWADQNGGFSLESIVVFNLCAVSIAVIITWVFNHTRGSLLLAMLVHSSVNTAQIMVVNTLFPSAKTTEINALIAFGGLALVLIVATRGRLGYVEPESEMAASRQTAPGQPGAS